VTAGPDVLRRKVEKRLANGIFIFQSPTKIGAAVEDVTGVFDLWQRVGAALTSPLDPETVTARLQTTAKRRHLIVHRYDEDPDNPPHKKTITVTETMAAIDFLDQLTEGIWTVLDGR
jgi:hypothetical protein